jgi:predicted RNA-binding Zn ribbon-like protein
MEPQATKFGFVGGALCLDFTNTVDGRLAIAQDDRLHSYSDLLGWSEQAKILNAREAQQLARVAAHQPEETQRVFEQAITLREAIYRMVIAVMNRRQPKAADLTLLNEVLSRALAQGHIATTKEGLAWNWRGDEEAFDQPLWQIARSAADLLTSERLNQVKKCEGETCGWLFIDASRNHSRRWCDMNDCGNRAKARRHYQRLRAKR